MPKPVVLVGGNGSGKTNLLSIIADALISAAAIYYFNVLPGMTPTHKPWFRVLGTRTIRVGTPGSFTVMQFEHEGTTYLFNEKGGHVPPDDARARLPESLHPAVAWGENDNIKQFAISDEEAGKIFEEGAYVYFPSNRAEAPHWLNQETVATAEFDVRSKFSRRSYKPIYVEKALEKLQQWILCGSSSPVPTTASMCMMDKILKSALWVILHAASEVKEFGSLPTTFCARSSPIPALALYGWAERAPRS
jgi:hypothetical protein